jgi:hypothetical protein
MFLPPDPGVYAEPKHDVRLYGTWKSDRKRTMAEWIWAPDVTPDRKRKAAGIFGKLVLRYTRDEMHAELNGKRTVTKYQVVGVDSYSVAFMVWESIMAERTIVHAHFEGRSHYWLALGRQREWFKRVPPATNRPKPRRIKPANLPSGAP